MTNKCQFDDRIDCPFEETPEDPEICKACASIKTLAFEESFKETQAELYKAQKVLAMGQLLTLGPAEDMTKSIDEEIQNILEEWIGGEED